MTIRELMKTELFVAQPEMPLQEAGKLLIEHRISGLPVVDDQRNIVGVMSEMDLINTFGEPDRVFRVVADVMTPRPISIDADAPLVEVFDCLMTHSFRRVLIHKEGKLVGLVSRADLLPYILDGLGE